MDIQGILNELNNSLEQVRIVAIVAAVFIAIIPPLNRLNSRFFTTIHELGHALAARLANGKVGGVWIFRNMDGVRGITLSHLPENAELIGLFPAGHMGVTVFSLVMIIFGNIPNVAPLVLGSTGSLLFLMFLLFGKQGRFPDASLSHQEVVTALVWLPISAGFIAIAWLLEPLWSVVTLNLLAVLGSVQALTTLRGLKGAVQQAAGGSDAEQMAEEFANTPFLKHPMFWVHVWSISSLLMLGVTYWLVWFGGAPVLAQG
ncbi:MAG: hypothetical protein Kow0031_25500 [Anaerolineae bacterium]